MWALYGSYYPRRARKRHLVIVSDQTNPCTVFALEGRIAAHIGEIGVDEPSARNLVASVCQYLIDTMSVIDLWPYTFVIEDWRKAERAECNFPLLEEEQSAGYFYHPVFETAVGEYSVYSDGIYRMPELIYSSDFSKHILNVPFRKCMFFISSALRYPDHTASFCIHAIESIRAAYGEGSGSEDRRRAWKAMDADIGSEQFSRLVSSGEYQSERHGQVIPRSWSDRAQVLAPTIEIAYRYACKLVP